MWILIRFYHDFALYLLPQMNVQLLLQFCNAILQQALCATQINLYVPLWQIPFSCFVAFLQ